jgi:hypothetical protein
MIVNCEVQIVNKPTPTMIEIVFTMRAARASWSAAPWQS